MSLDEIKRNNDLIALISESVQLVRKGNNYWGLCPFHREKTASFSVSQSRQRFRCWGCGASGDAIDFIKRRDGVDFNAARDFLAVIAGLRVEASPADHWAAQKAQEKRDVNNRRQAMARKIIREQTERLIVAEKRCHLFLQIVQTPEDMERPQTVWAAHTVSKVESVLYDLERADDCERLKIALAVRWWKL
mgnify:CR=1 FL=1